MPQFRSLSAPRRAALEEATIDRALLIERGRLGRLEVRFYLVTARAA